MREVEEWVGKTDDEAIPTRVFLRVWSRSNGRCAICGRRIQVGEKKDTDHIKSLGLGGQHRESNLQVVHRACHRGKSADEVRRMRKADRVAAKHLGLRKPRTITRWRKFSGEIVIAPRER